MQSLSSTYPYAVTGRHSTLADSADLVARIALAAVFIWSGIGKLFLGTAGNVGYMEAYQVPFAGVLVYAAGLIEVVGGAGRISIDAQKEVRRG